MPFDPILRYEAPPSRQSDPVLAPSIFAPGGEGLPLDVAVINVVGRQADPQVETPAPPAPAEATLAVTLGSLTLVATVTDGSLIQGSQANAKEDTVLLLLSQDMSIDLSQFGVDLVADGLGGYLDPDPLRAITGATGRELYVRPEIDPVGVDSAILAHADPADINSNTFLVQWMAPEIRFFQGSTTIHRLLTGFPDVSDVSIMWTTRPNPDTTGPGDQMLSEFTVFDHTSGDYLEIQEQVRHAISTTDAAWATSVGGFWDGASLTLPSGVVQSCRIGRAGDHSSVEFHEDWIAERTAPVADPSPIEPILLPSVDSDVGADGEWAGSANIAVIAEHNRRMRRRGWSPLVNEVYLDAGDITTTPNPTQWVKFAPDSVNYRMRLDKLRWVPVPRGASHVWVRIQVRSYVAAGSPVPVFLRLYAMNRNSELTKIEQPQAPVFEYAFAASDELTVDHTSGGIGEWLEWGGEPGVLVRLPVWTPEVPAYKDTVHLALAYAIDPNGDSANDANERLQIRAWHARSVYRFVGQGLG